MKRALVVGINDYDSIKSLNGCINDANRIHKLISRHEDGSPNFDVELMTLL